MITEERTKTPEEMYEECRQLSINANISLVEETRKIMSKFYNKQLYSKEIEETEKNSNDALCFAYSSFPYLKILFKWEYENFPREDLRLFPNYFNFLYQYEEDVIKIYLRTINACTSIITNYDGTPEQAERPLTAKERKLFDFFLKEVLKPATESLINGIKNGNYRTLKEISKDRDTMLLESVDIQKQTEINSEIDRPSRDLFVYLNVYSIDSHFEKAIIEAFKSNVKPKSKKKQPDAVATPFEISPYSLVLSNQFARSAMLMNTSRPLEKKSLLDSSVQVFAPKLREEGIDGITQIAIDTEHLGDITATWGTAEKRLFAMYNEAICRGGEEAQEVVININDYMKRCDLSASNKKETVKELKKAIDRMFYTSVRFEDDKGSKANFALFETTAYHNGNIFIKGTDRLVTAMTGGKGGRNVMHLPAEYYTCKGKNAVSAMNVIQALCYHQGNYNNVIRSMMYENHQSEHYKVSSLLKKTEITTIEKVRATQQSWKSKIKEPLEAILNDFPGVPNWGYIINDKLRLPEELPPDLTYEEWESLTIQYNIENFPNERVIQGIETKKAKKEEARQILSDKAAVARAEERKARKKKAASNS